MDEQYGEQYDEYIEAWRREAQRISRLGPDERSEFQANLLYGWNRYVERQSRGDSDD